MKHILTLLIILLIILKLSKINENFDLDNLDDDTKNNNKEQSNNKQNCDCKELEKYIRLSEKVNDNYNEIKKINDQIDNVMSSVNTEPDEQTIT